MLRKIENKIQEFTKKRNAIAILFLLVFMGLSVILNNIHLSQIASENTKILSKFISIGDHREVAYILKEAQLSNFTSIRYISPDKNRSFILPSKLEVIDEPSFIRSIYNDRITVPVQSGIGTVANESIEYEFNRFRLVPHAIFIWIFIMLASIPQVRFMKQQMIEKFKTDLDVEKKLAKAEIAHLVRHNLRTPLSALMKLSDESIFNIQTTESDILKSTIYQINEIINKLDDKKTVSKNLEERSDIHQTLFRSKNQIALTIPKNISFTFKIDDSLFSAMTDHIPFELKSILSNVINNSVESIDGQGFIHVKAMDNGHSLVITVTDCGSGISEEILPCVFDQNFTHNKQSGSGLGLYHAKDFVTKWGGSIDIESTINTGTTFKITLPIRDRKSWHISHFKIKQDSKIFILDDQSLTHDLWRLKFKDLEIKNPVYNATSAEEIINLLEAHKGSLESALFLFDYDIQDSQNGLDLLKRLPFSATRCLVSGHYDDLKMQSDCEQSSIKLMPKSEISDIPFVII